MVGRWSAASSGGQRGLLFLLVVLLGDDLDACGEGGEAVDVVAVAVGEDDGGDWLRCDLGDVVEEFLAAGFRGLRVDDDDAAGSDDDGAVAAAALDPVDVRLELVGDEGCRRRRGLARSLRLSMLRDSPIEVR